MTENILLVVQTPNRGGQRGHQILVANIDPTKFDEDMWLKGKSDELILTLAHVQKMAIKQFRTVLESNKFVRHLIRTKQARDEVINVKLDFALPTRPEASRAAERLHRAIKRKIVMDHDKRVAELAHKVECHTQHIASITQSMTSYRAHLKQPRLLSGIRLHYEQILIRDCKIHLVHARKELKITERELVRAIAARIKLNTP